MSITLGAHADDESDSLSYLRDQLQALGYLHEGKERAIRGSGDE